MVRTGLAVLTVTKPSLVLSTGSRIENLTETYSLAAIACWKLMVISLLVVSILQLNILYPFSSHDGMYLYKSLVLVVDVTLYELP